MTNKQILQITIEKFTEKTGIKCHYERQKNNGTWLYFATADNNGQGFYIGVNGYIDAANVIDNILNGYNLAKSGRF